MATATKTIIQQLETKHPDWVAATSELFNQAIVFYFDILQGHQSLLELPTKQLLTHLEKLSVKTVFNPEPTFPLPWELPAMFRRACINSAIGRARSFYSNLERWHKQKEKAEVKGKKFVERPPVPPREFHQHPLLYAGMYRFDGGNVLLKLFTGTTWCWIKFRMAGRTTPPDWQAASPKLVLKAKRITLHIPIEKQIKVNKIQQQIKADGEFCICAVDLNINNNLAVCRILRADGSLIASRFIGGGDSLSGRRKRALGRIANKRSKTGSLNKAEKDNKQLWAKVNNIDKYEAHRVSRRIVEFAAEYGAKVIVFEHLANFRPERGKYSRRANSKRSFWLRGKIFAFTKYKAFELGIITSRVNPRNTSRDCAYCGTKVARHNQGEEPIEYRAGAPLYTCPNGHKGNADLNAANNIALRLFARYNISVSLQKSLSKDKVVSLLYTGAGQESRDGQVAPPSVSAVNYVPNAVEATPQLLPVATIRGCA
ncbi:MAG: transposase [Acidobacteriota bacterium]